MTTFHGSDSRSNLLGVPRRDAVWPLAVWAVPGFLLSAVASTHSETRGWNGQELRAELHINQGELSDQYLDLLKSQRTEIEREMGGELNWYSPEDANACRIYSRKDVNLYDPDARNEQYSWLVDQLERLRRVFEGRIQELEPAS